MIRCKKYDMDSVDFSIEITKSSRNARNIKIEKGLDDKQAQKMSNKATTADRMLIWLKTGKREGLSEYTECQLNEIKREIQRFQSNMERDGIDLDNQFEVIAYIYARLHLETLYKSPLVLTGRWENDAGNNNIYGGLVEKYTPCAGMSQSAELLCKLCGIDAKTVQVNNAGVGHAMNAVSLENGKYLFFDIADSIGMTADGKYEGAFSRGDLRERSKYLYSPGVKLTAFGKKNTPIFYGNDRIIFEDAEPEIISDNEKMEVFTSVVQKINRHRNDENKIEVIPPKQVKIQIGGKQSKNIRITKGTAQQIPERTHIQAGVYQDRTTPQEILQASIQYMQDNPGQISEGVRESKGLFLKILDRIKGIKDKDR